MNAKIRAVLKSDPDFPEQAVRTEYLCHVSFQSYRDDLQFLKDWLKSYGGVDIDETHRQAHALLCDENYARAVVGTYFRTTWPRLEVDFDKVVSADALPAGPPTFEGEKYKLWVSTVSETPFTTPKIAAQMLYAECRRLKLSVESARYLVSNRFPGESLFWDEILEEFDNLGGAHTDKYLRRKS